MWKDPIVGGETLEHVGERADGVIVRALEATDAGGGPTSQNRDPSTDSGQIVGYPMVEAADDLRRVLLFGHAHVLRILAARWVGLGPIGGSLLALGTGSVSVLGCERETRVVQEWNRGFEG